MKAEELKDLIIEKQDELINLIEFCDPFGYGYFSRRNKIKHRLADLWAQLNKLNQDCIEKAASNLSKIEEKQESFKLNRCKGCGFPIAIGNDYCSECMCEDDCAPD